MTRHLKFGTVIIATGLGLVLAFSSSLNAQETGAEEETTDEDIVYLSVFDVDATRDDRYRATNTVSATGLNTPIKELPMSIQVITSEFITDLGATDFDEALSYATGVNTTDLEADSGGGGADANNGGGSAEKSASASSGGSRFVKSVSIRGYKVPFQNRLGFRYGGVVITPESAIALGGVLDSVNMDRMEVVKGPNSLLYGIGVISGIVNVMPKKPLSEQRQSFSAAAGSEGFMRFTGDITGPIVRQNENNKHRLNYRLLGSYEERDDWTDFAGRELKYGAFQLDYWYDTRWNVFAEVQVADARYNGTGAQWIYDDMGRALVQGHRNEYDEQYNYAQDGDAPGLDRIVFESGARGRRTDVFATPDIEDRVLHGSTLPDTTRLTGPDTYEQREETDLLLDATFTPSENWAFSAGVFYTKADEEEFAVNVRNLNNREGRFNIRNSLPLNYDDLDSSEFAHLLYGLKNTLQNDLIDGFDPEVIQSVDDRKLNRYWWSLRPQRTESLQTRLRGTYNFDTPFFFDTETSNTFLVGYQYINDSVDFLDGEEGVNRAVLDRNHPYILTGRVPTGEAAGADALYFRSIDDFSVLRFEGHNLAMPGAALRNQDIGYHGAYGILQSKFWDEKIGLILGLRYDRYNAETKELIRISPEDLAIGVNNSLYVDNPYSVVYGETEATKSFDEDIEAWSNTLALNYDINRSLNLYGLYSEGISPNTSLVDGNNETIPAENTQSIEFGLKWEAFEGRLSGSIAAYQIKRNNAIWDFTEAPSPSQWIGTPNPPHRSQLIPTAFNPQPIDGLLLSYGVDEDFIPQDLIDLQGTHLVTQAIEGEPGRNKAWFVLDPVTNEMTRVLGLLDYANYGTEPLQPFTRRNIWHIEYLTLDDKQTFNVHIEDPEGTIVHNGRTYSLKTFDIIWRQSIEEAFSRTDMSSDIVGSYDPIRYVHGGELQNGVSNQPSGEGGEAAGLTFVTFDDKSQGVDLELIYSPTGSLQFILNYSHIERKAEGAFHMVDWIDLNTGIAYGTEYEKIYFILGRENGGITGTDTNGDGYDDHFVDVRGNEITMDNPARPTDFVGGIDDVSLHFNPEDEASLWSRYTLTEGPLKQLGFGLGIRYYGPAQTSIPIGGTSLGKNLFQTPDTKERWRFDAALYYNFNWLDANWRLSLNIYNLADDTEGLNIAAIPNPATGGTVTKRTRILYAPRSYRMGVTLDF
jgi:outer membrane receptor protein involved in Fe transport